MKISCNIATYHKREHSLYEVLEYVTNQTTPFDVIRIYANDYEPNINHPKIEVVTEGEDITDRGKFWFLQHLEEPEIYFSWDDDLKMPPDYVETTVGYLEQYGGIVTYHGRKLKGKGLHYYRDHETHHFKFQVGGDKKVDVGGTGVMAFYSNEFRPDVLQYEYDKMVDVLIGLEAAKQGIPITAIDHRANWIDNIATQDAIYREFRNDCEVQSNLCDEIWNIRSH